MAKSTRSTRAMEFDNDLAQLKAVSDDHLDIAVSTLQADLDDLRQAVVDTGTQARTTSQPLVEDGLDDVARSWAVVRDTVKAECG
jgi:hypothetical protein